MNLKQTEVLLEAAEAKGTLTTTVMSLQTGPWRERRFVIVNTSPAMMAAEIFSKPATELAAALLFSCNLRELQEA